MTFLQAHATVKAFTGGEDLPALIAMSGTAEPMLVFLKAAAAQRGFLAKPRFLPFNTLQQAILGGPSPEGQECFVLMPWDLIPELDWRTGVALRLVDDEVLRAQARTVLQRIADRGARIVYLPAPCPPLCLDPARNAAMLQFLLALALEFGAKLIDGAAFSLRSYLSSGLPFDNTMLGAASAVVMGAIVEGRPEFAPRSAKVLVTDLDQTLWSGIIGDDGPEGIAYGPAGKGYRHFIYQTLLRRLREDGVLLAVVTKNDPEPVLVPFAGGNMVLQRDDFVVIIASWNAKSAQIRALAQQLNLGLDAFVFVDDNPVELAEVAAELPDVHRVQFPTSDADLTTLISELTRLFARSSVTIEDRERTAMYRRRFETILPTDAVGGDISEFLKELRMTLEIRERKLGDSTRSLQLINKTNQFNLNGRRLSNEELAQQLANGSRLFSATLTDRAGGHGEILAALVDPAGCLTAMVMSCRVFQRRIEHAILAWLITQGVSVTHADYMATERNGPVKMFLNECAATTVASGMVPLDSSAIASRGRVELELFTIVAGSEITP